jgi:HK97 family phage major capsid protein
MTVSNYIDKLVADRDQAWGEQRAVIERAVDEKREPTAEERAHIARTDEAIDKADGEMAEWRKRLTSAAEADKAREEVRSVLTADQRQVVERRDDTEADQVRKFLAGEIRSLEVNIGPAARESALVRGGGDRSEFRDLVSNSDAAGGRMVPTTLARTLYRAMETINGVRASGPYVITTTSGEPLNIPKISAAGTAALVGEGTALAEADAAFTVVTLNSWKYGQLVQVTSELLTDSAVDVLGMVGEDTGRALARVTNTAYTTGSGSNAPYGFVTQSLLGGTGIVSQTTATGVPSYANLVDLVYSVGDESYAGPDAVFQTRFANFAALRKIQSPGGHYIWEPSLAAGQPSTLLGYRLVSNPALAAWGTAAATNTMAFGDFYHGVIIRDVAGIRLERSDDFAFSSDMVTFRAILRTDSDMRDRTAVKIMQAPTT